MLIHVDVLELIHAYRTAFSMHIATLDQGATHIAPEQFDLFVRKMDELCEMLGKLNLALTLKVAQRVRDRMRVLQPLGELKWDCREIITRLEDEADSLPLIGIPQAHRPYYEQKEPLFGSRVNFEFSAASYDIEEAGKCYALGRWTACVFHLMRVLEHGLHKTANSLQVHWPQSRGVEYQGWQTIIDQIENHVTGLADMPNTTPNKKELLGAYSQLATNFLHFKDAWRNDVSHSRVSYDEERASRIFGAVKSFMQDAATVPPLP